MPRRLTPADGLTVRIDRVRHVPRADGAAALEDAVEVELPLDGHSRPLGDPRLHDAVVAAAAALARAGSA